MSSHFNNRLAVCSWSLQPKSPEELVEHLQEKRILASVAPYRTPHVRLTPSIRNTPEEIDRALAVIRAYRANA